MYIYIHIFIYISQRFQYQTFGVSPSWAVNVDSLASVVPKYRPWVGRSTATAWLPSVALRLLHALGHVYATLHHLRDSLW